MGGNPAHPGLKEQPDLMSPHPTSGTSSNTSGINHIPGSAWRWTGHQDAWFRQARLISGLIIFAFVLTHLLNHALGLVSLDIMEQVQGWRLDVTRSLPGTVLLYGAFCVHILLALYKTAMRQSLRLPSWELIQLLLGLAIPLLLIPHLGDTRVSNLLIDFDDRYRDTIPGYWPRHPFLPLALVALAWSHGCIGLHFWLRFRRWYSRGFLIWFALAVAIPVLACAGFVTAGKAISAEKALRKAKARRAAIELPIDRIQPSVIRLASFVPLSSAVGTAIDQRHDYLPVANKSPNKKRWTYGQIEQRADQLRWVFLAIALLALGMPLYGSLWRRRGPRVEVNYPENRRVSTPQGPTLLEISRSNRIPHTSICGGRGRCSTCRVQLGRTSDPQPVPNSIEASLLARIHAPEEVRLACQLRPQGRIDVTPLVPAGRRSRATGFDSDSLGVEREIVVLFADLRGFTSLSEHRLPYDTVFLLNEYFTRQEAVIRQHGGRVDKYMGDGIMALFGAQTGDAARLESPDIRVDQACRQALSCLGDMLAALDELNRDDRIALDQPLRIAIGLHVGQAVLGAIGAGSARQMTAIGDVVNAAARLESLAKELDVPMVASAAVLRHAGHDIDRFAVRTVEIRGKQQSLDVVARDQTLLAPPAADQTALSD